MRTTIEISERQRSILISLAAQKGLRGYSKIVQDALDFYISHQAMDGEAKTNILKMKGSWGKQETEKVRSRLAELRSKATGITA